MRLPLVRTAAAAALMLTTLGLSAPAATATPTAPAISQVVTGDHILYVQHGLPTSGDFISYAIYDVATGGTPLLSLDLAYPASEPNDQWDEQFQSSHYFLDSGSQLTDGVGYYAAVWACSASATIATSQNGCVSSSRFAFTYDTAADGSVASYVIRDTSSYDHGFQVVGGFDGFDLTRATTYVSTVFTSPTGWNVQVPSGWGDVTTHYNDQGMWIGYAEVTDYMNLSCGNTYTTGSFHVGFINRTDAGFGAWVRSDALEVDPDAPMPPMYPSNSDREVTSSTVALDWDEPYCAQSAAWSITGYRVEMSTDRGVTWTVVDADTESTDTGYLVDGLSSGQTYDFRVAALSGAVVGGWKVFADVTLPTVPAGGTSPGGAGSGSSSGGGSSAPAASGARPQAPSPVVPAVPATSVPVTKPIGAVNPVVPVTVASGVTLVSQEVAASTPVRAMKQEAGAKLSAAPVVQAAVGKPVSLAAAGLAENAVYTVKIKVNGKYVEVGEMASDADGRGRLPVLTLRKPGTYTVAMVGDNGQTRYVKITVLAKKKA